MEEGDRTFGTGNFNDKWTNNIYENMKLIEKSQRLAMEGCESLLDFVMMPMALRKVQIGLIQYKNLKLLINEFRLVLADLSPVVEKEKLKVFFEWLKTIDGIIDEQDRFVKISYGLDNQIKETKVTPFFTATLQTFYSLKIMLFHEIKPMLFVNLTPPE